MTSSTETPANWPNLQKLLDAALALPEADRLAWLANSRDIPDALREPLRRLLEVQAGIATRPFLNTLPNVETGLTPAASVLIGDLIGPYRLLQELGDGGMGSVWLAERADGALKRKVALKLPRLAWASDLAGRMARERDILSSLEHPNIARLYDAGVDRLGRPFLALEYVEGQRLDRYCDANTLSIEQRIRLFLQVLDAVQYAHVNLVLHRDIKPANVLVNQRGEIRLLDFGIAKLLDENTEPNNADPHSRTLSRAMTPRYASPEQVQQSRLTLASDIYSLGVFLYELLVGASPLITNSGSRAELEIAIVDAHIRTASRARIPEEVARNRSTSSKRLSRLLRGELDAVIHKAMARNPVDRYVSAEALRADLLRWLEGHPVEATPPSRLLALRKFVTRNALAVGLGSAAVAAIVITAGIAVLQAREARLESRRATATRDFLLGLFENANPELHGGRDVTARELLLDGDKNLRKTLDGQPQTYAEVLRAVADAWGRLGEYDNMAEVAARRSAILQGAGEEGLYIKASIEEAQIAAGRGDVVKVEQLVRTIGKAKDDSDFAVNEEADFYWLKGWLRLRSERYREASDEFQKSLSVLQGSDYNRSARAHYGVMMSSFGALDRSGALKNYRSAILDARHPSVTPGERLRRSFEIIAALYVSGEYLEGWPGISLIFKDARSIYGPELTSQHPVFLYWTNWAIKIGELEEAKRWFKELKPREKGKFGENGKFFEIEWALTEARLSLASGDFQRVEAIIGGIKQKEISVIQRRSIDVIRAENYLRMKSPEKALNVFSSEDWKALNRENSGASNEWRIYQYWMEGVAFGQMGDEPVAAARLQYAANLSKKLLGREHPQPAVITLAEKLARAKSIMTGEEKDKSIQEIQYALSVLRRSYPASSGIVVDGEIFLEAMRSSDSREAHKRLKDISNRSPFL